MLLFVTVTFFFLLQYKLLLFFFAEIIVCCNIFFRYFCNSYFFFYKFYRIHYMIEIIWTNYFTKIIVSHKVTDPLLKIENLVYRTTTGLYSLYNYINIRNACMCMQCANKGVGFILLCSILSRFYIFPREFDFN